MALFRFLLFLLILAGLAAIAVQNLTLIHLVILGQKTISLPLSFWLLGAIALGGMTSIFLTGLIEWTSFWSRRQERRYYQDNQQRPTSAKTPPTKPRWNPFARDRRDDEADADVWDGPLPRPAAQPSAFRPPNPPKEVVDADFRVIRPPSRNLDDE
jgi:uncharacterized integral membrane protein